MLLPGLVTEEIAQNPKAPPGSRSLTKQLMAQFIDWGGGTLGDPFSAGPGWAAVDMLGAGADPAQRVEALARKVPTSMSVGSGFGLQLAMLAAGIDPQTRERLRDDTMTNRAMRMAGIMTPGWTPFVGYYYQALERADEKAPDPRGFYRDTTDAILRYGLSVRVVKMSREQAERNIRTTAAWAGRIHGENVAAKVKKLRSNGKPVDEVMRQAQITTAALHAALQIKLRELGAEPMDRRERDAILDAHWFQVPESSRNLTPGGPGVE